MKLKISLYECALAKYPTDNEGRIYCAKGYRLGKHQGGTVSVQRLMRGEPLVYEICQTCKKFNRNGEPLPQEERGWLEVKI